MIIHMIHLRLSDVSKNTLVDCKLHKGRDCTYFLLIFAHKFIPTSEPNFWHILRLNKDVTSTMCENYN